jgi:hypothetical protein
MECDLDGVDGTRLYQKIAESLYAIMSRSAAFERVELSEDVWRALIKYAKNRGLVLPSIARVGVQVKREDITTQVFQAFPGIESYSVNFLELFEDPFSQLDRASLEKLKSVRVEYQYGDSDEILEMLGTISRMVNLESLEIVTNSAGVTPEPKFITTLKELPKLKRLEVSKSSSEIQDFLTLVPQTLAESLRELKVGNLALNPKEIPALAKFKNLESLTAIVYFEFDVLITAISQLHLKHLSITSRIPPRDLSGIEKLRFLEDFEMDWRSISSQQSLKQLSTIILKSKKMRRLALIEDTEFWWVGPNYDSNFLMQESGINRRSAKIASALLERYNQALAAFDRPLIFKNFQVRF